MRMGILSNTQRKNLWLTSLLTLRLVQYLCEAQELPFFDTATFTVNVTHRSNYCFLYEQTYQGNIERRDSLRGQTLSIGVMDYHLDPDTGGIDNNEIAFHFLDELARRADFKWRNSYGVLKSPSSGSNYTWDDLLLWGTRVYDVMGEYYARNLQRLEMGLDFVDYWYDASLIMIMKKNVEEFQWFTFLQPFSWQVWMLIGFTSVSSAMFYYLIDYLDSRRNSTKMETSIGDQLFFASYAFTGHSQYQPRSISTQFLAFSLCFTYLVLLSIYTANMASVLIQRSKASVVVNTLDDAIKADMKICVWESTSAENFLLLHHKDAKRVPFHTEDECAAALVRGDCQVYLTYVNSWEILKRDARYNNDCSLGWVGRKVTSTPGSFSIDDNKELCSKLLEDVLTIHMVDMKIDGTFDRIWNDYYKASASVDCISESNENLDGEIYMTSKQLGSLFLLHFAFMIIALIIAIIRCCRMPDEEKIAIKRELKRSARNPVALKEEADFLTEYREIPVILGHDEEKTGLESTLSRDEKKVNDIHESTSCHDVETANDIHKSTSCHDEEKADDIYESRSSHDIKKALMIRMRSKLYQDKEEAHAEDSLNAQVSTKQTEISKDNHILEEIRALKELIINLTERNKEKDD